MVNYVAGLTFIWVLFVGSFGWAYLRVSRSGKYGGTPFKAQNWQDRNWQNSQKLLPVAVTTESSGLQTVSLATAAKPVVNHHRGGNGGEMVTAINQELVDLQGLGEKLYHQIDTSWQNWPTFDKNLVYRVMVSELGTIAQYQPLNQPAREYATETPLPALVQTSPVPPEPTAEFTVVFTPSGILEVSP